VATITRTGNDPFGLFLHDALKGFGVDDRWVTAVDGLPTPLAFCEIFPPDDFPLYFYREPKAPDLEIKTEELDLDAIRDAKVFWATVTGLSQEPSRSATLAALEASEGITVLDLDWRPMFWPSRDEGRRWVREALRFADVAVGNEDEWETAGDASTALVVRKRGPRGTFAHRGAESVDVPPAPVEVVNGLGAGDAFGGALCHGLLADWPLERMIRFANAAGAIVAGRLACADAMPTTEEVEAKIDA
jgi:5-dehydro-2-deoxygluconokinase